MSEMQKREAYWTYQDKPSHRAYYFAPCNRAPPPYRKQIEVTAILDIASDRTLAGVELAMGQLPPAPKMERDSEELDFKIAMRRRGGVAGASLKEMAKKYGL